MTPPLTAADAGRHRVDDRAVAFVFNRPIAAEHPDEIVEAAGEASEIRPVGKGVFRGEYLRTDAPFLIELVPPGGQQHDYHPPAAASPSRKVTSEKYRSSGFIGSPSANGQRALSVRSVKAIEFGNGGHLHGVKPLRGADVQVFDDFPAVQPLQQGPGGVGEIREQLPRSSTIYRRLALIFSITAPLPSRTAPVRRGHG